MYKFDTSYYQSKNIFGYKGDFVTSPHISSIFSEMLAFWTFSYWDKIKKPKDLNILELGPGDGTMAKDIITTLKKIKHFNGKINYFFLEKSKYLKKKQKEKLIHLNNIYWIKNIKDFQKNNLVILSNEFFDALPVKQFIKKKISGLKKEFNLIEKLTNYSFFLSLHLKYILKKYLTILI